MGISAGQLRHRVKILTHEPAVDEYGAPIPVTSDSWAEYVTLWAAIEPIRGREFFEAQQVQNEVTTRIRIRYREDIKPDMRVQHKDNVYSIVSVLKDNFGRHVHLMCKMLSSEQEESEE